MKRAILMLAALALLLVGVGQAKAEFIITFSQSGANVVANGSGSLNFLDLAFQGFYINNPTVNASQGMVVIGPTGAYADYYGNITGPTSFGAGGNVFADFGSGTAPNGTDAGVDGATHQLFLPGGYGAGSFFTESSTWNNTTIAGLGLTPGTYTWNWGSGANADSLVVVIPGSATAVPEPASMTLLGIAGVTFAGYFGWRRRKTVVA